MKRWLVGTAVAVALGLGGAALAQQTPQEMRGCGRMMGATGMTGMQGMMHRRAALMQGQTMTEMMRACQNMMGGWTAQSQEGKEESPKAPEAELNCCAE